tara:strand:- start:427 stop:777 length:351 start_codon:yes stop_codon:yes gene_type:complete
MSLQGMMFDSRIETLLDIIRHKADKAGCDIAIRSAFDDDRESMAAVVHNIETDSFGLVACDVAEYADDTVSCFKFNGKLYDYYKAEGFEKSTIASNMQGDVFVKMSPSEFCTYITE